MGTLAFLCYSIVFYVSMWLIKNFLGNFCFLLNCFQNISQQFITFHGEKGIVRET